MEAFNRVRDGSFNPFPQGNHKLGDSTGHCGKRRVRVGAIFDGHI